MGMKRKKLSKLFFPNQIMIYIKGRVKVSLLTLTKSHSQGFFLSEVSEQISAVAPGRTAGDHPYTLMLVAK